MRFRTDEATGRRVALGFEVSHDTAVPALNRNVARGTGELSEVNSAAAKE